MSDLIIDVAKLREMHGTCTLLETSGYVVDAKSHTILLPVRILKQAKMKPYFNNLTFIFTYFFDNSANLFVCCIPVTGSPSESRSPIWTKTDA